MKLRLWSAQFMANPARSGTLEEAVEAAKRFHLIAAHDWYFKGKTDQMFEANPDLVLGVYNNTTFTWKKDLPEDAYAHGISGSRVYAREWSDTLCLEPTSERAIAWTAEDVLRQFKRSGYNAVYLDVAGPAPLVANYVNEVPVDPRTGQAWQWPAWNAAVRILVQRIRQAVDSYRPGAVIFQNSLGSGDRYFAPAGTSDSVDLSVQGYEAELWVRDPEAPLTQTRNVDQWKRDLAMLAAVERLEDCFALPMTKTWGSGTEAQRDSWMRFACASFLLEARPKSRLCLTRTKNDNLADHSQGIAGIDLGRAMSAYREWGGAYRREFEGGVVVANPTKQPLTVDLGAVCDVTDGFKASTHDLAPYDGAVFRKSA